MILQSVKSKIYHNILMSVRSWTMKAVFSIIRYNYSCQAIQQIAMAGSAQTKLVSFALYCRLNILFRWMVSFIVVVYF